MYVINLPAFSLESSDLVARAFKEGRFIKVEECCKGVLQRAPETDWAWYFVGRLPAKDTESAIDFLGTARSLSPNNLDILCDLSRVYARSYQFVLAEERPQQAMALQPNSAPALIALDQAYELSAQAEGSWSLQERAVVLAPSPFSDQLSYGQGLQDRGRLKVAFKHLKCAVTLEPNNLEALIAWGKCYASNGQHKATVDVFTIAKGLSLMEVWLFYEVARSLFDMADSDRALEWINLAITANSAAGCFYEEHVFYLHNKKDFQGCIEAINKAIERGWSMEKDTRLQVSDADSL